MNINHRVSLLRNLMKAHNLDAYIIPSSDPHNSEYVADLWKSREWISGFTGSAGVVVVTQSHAGVWTDSRYFLQAETELNDSEFELHKVYNQFAPQHVEWLINHLPENSTIGFDGFCMTQSSVKAIDAMCAKKQMTINGKHDLIASIWENRVSIPLNEIFLHDIKFSGKSTADKISEIQGEMQKQDINYHLVTTLDDLAWIFNIRGNDVECNPVAICYGIIDASKATLFIDPEKVPAEVKAHLEGQNVTIQHYDQMVSFLNQLTESDNILVDPSNCSHNLYRAINAKIKNGKTISRRLKALKNKVEVNHFRNAMVKDGVALLKAFKWLEEKISTQSISEFEFAQKLAECRSTQSDYKGESFHAIIGYRGNGAIIHYRPMEDTAHHIKPEGILLCDSGGQYLDGTTDITRTIALSTPSEEEKTNFTLVLKGMIGLSMAVFPKGTNGGQLDILARQHLWNHGLNYLHGTGHGVGFFLNVHEAPQGFAPGSSERARTIHEVGMVSSNEPGYYKEGAYGIRIENLIVTIEDDSKPGFLKHETLTLFPIDLNLIDLDLMTESEKNWLNNYHTKVMSELSIHLDPEEKEWLSNKCRSI